MSYFKSNLGPDGLTPSNGLILSESISYRAGHLILTKRYSNLKGEVVRTSITTIKDAWLEADDLTEALRLAVENENYELAAILRDKMLKSKEI